MAETTLPRSVYGTVALAVILLPLVVGFGLAHEVISRYHELGRQQLEDTWQDSLDRLIAAQDAFPSALKEMRQPLLEVRYRMADLKAVAIMLESRVKKLNMRSRIYVYQNGRKQLVWPSRDPFENRWRQVLATLSLTGRRLDRVASRLDPWLRATFGATVSMKRLQRHLGEYFPVRFKGQPGLLFVECGGDGLAFALIVDRMPTWRWREVLEHRRSLLDVLRVTGRAVPDLGIWYAPRGVSTDDMRLAYALAARRAGATVLFRARMWMFDTDRRGLVTALAIPIGTHRTGAGSASILGLAALALILCAVRLTVLAPGRSLSTASSLRRQLQVLFGIITLMPLASAIILAWFSHEEKAEMLHRAAGKRSYEVLQRVVADFPSIRRHTLEICRQIRTLCATSTVDIANLREVVDQLRENWEIDAIDLRDTQSRKLFSNLNKDREQVSQMMGLLAQYCIKRHVPDRLPASERERVSKADLFIEQLFGNDSVGWSSVVEHPGKLVEAHLSRLPIDFFWDILPGTGTEPTLLTAFHTRNMLMKNYLVRHVIAESMQQVGVVMAVPATTSVAVPGVPTLATMYSLNADIYPGFSPSDKARVADLLVRIDKTVSPQYRRFNIAGHRVWSVGLTEPMTQRWPVLAIEDADAALAQLAPFRYAAAGGLILALIVAALAGRLLASLIIVPIGDLARGIEAIRARDTRFRIAVRRDDEFGELATMFNHMLGELRELELARVVQSALMPAAPPDFAGYSFAARSISATDVGGDYYDLVPIDEHRLLIVVGDVTGHGISAALAMSMARAAVVWQLQEGFTDLGPILTALNDVFFTELRSQRKFMSLILATIDHTRHELTLLNAGHHPPLFYRAATGETGQFEAPGSTILGARRKVVAKSHVYQLDPGDAIVFFTDGYTEALLPDGEQLGEGPLTDTLERVAVDRVAAADTILSESLAAFYAVRAPGPLDDDVTLLVARRTS